METADRNSFIKRSQINVIDAKADVFWMAFKGLPKKEKQSVVERLLTDTEFMDYLIDIATSATSGISNPPEVAYFYNSIVTDIY